MIKRPLGMICLVVTCMIFLVTEMSGIKKKEAVQLPKSNISVTGTIYKKTPPSEKNPGGIIYLKDASKEDQNVICYLQKGEQIPEMGCRVTVRGYPSVFRRATNPGQFDSEFYYQISDISFRISQANILAKSTSYHRFQEGLYRLRCFLAEQLKRNLSPKDAAVVSTILLGIKGDLDEEVKALYQRNGIAHILSISGLHISMLGMGAFHICKRAGGSVKGSAVAASLFMLCYGVMTGFSVSMLRAVIMFLLHMLAKLVGRTYDMLTAVGVAAVLILVEQPLYLYDAGFVFSFGCVLGIGLILPLLTERKQPLPHLWKSLLSGCGMAVISFPMYLWFYYQFPPYSVLLNLLIVPLMSFLMAAGLALLLLQLVFPTAAFFPAMIITGILRIYEILCSFCDTLPGHTFTLGKPQLWQIIIYVGVMVLLIFLKKKISLKIKWLIVLGAVFLLCIRPGGALEFAFLDVGQGDSIYIKSPKGKHYLIDGGSSSVSDVGQYRILPFLKWKGANELEAVIVTHPDEDHVNGIAYLLEQSKVQGVKIHTLVLPAVEKSLQNEAYDDLEQLASKSSIKVEYIFSGAVIADGELQVVCLNPEQGSLYDDTNEYSTVLAIYYREFRALLTGDVEGTGEQTVVRNLIEKEAESMMIKADENGNTADENMKQNTENKIVGLNTADENMSRNTENRTMGLNTADTYAGRHFTLLKAAHHGSRYSTGEAFLAQVRPLYTIISCGENNRYGHPHEETLERLAEVDTTVYQTKERGAIMVWTDGKKMRIEAFNE